jgi:glycosyltransferase involved in cell wall biosynthesis
MTAPLVSVVVPAYRSGPHLDEALASVARQSHRPLEVIVVDDGSPDASVRTIADRFPGVRYLRQANAGSGAARNAGVRAARGALIALLDHDDLWAEDKLAVQVAVIARHPASGFVACDGVQFDGDRVLAPRLLNGRLARALDATATGEFETRDYRAFIEFNPISTPSQVVIPRAILDRVGPFTEHRNEAPDIEYYLRVARRYPVTLHREPLARWRYLPTSRSGPIERRGFEWALMMVPVLRREMRRCDPRDRRFVAVRVHTLVREHVREAYYYGRQQDARYARGWLLRLARHRPDDPVVLAAWLALYMPAPLISRFARLARALTPGSARASRDGRRT